MSESYNKNKNSYIEIIGAKQHNLKNISLKIPKNKLIVITGVSGSGKSSLAFDTLFAEGQRRYIESLSSYARQFLGKIQKPNVEDIKGICPAIAIEQKTTTNNTRSTIGTSTEIYDYLKILFARIGKTFSPVSGKIVKRHQIIDIVNFILKQKKGGTIIILANYLNKKKNILNSLTQQGFSRILLNNEIHRISKLIENNIAIKNKYICVVIDRLKIDEITDENRIYDSIQTAFYEGNGECRIQVDNKITDFSNKFELDGINFVKPSTNLFSFNNPFGACKTCEGFGSVLGIDKKKVLPNEKLSVYEGTVACWSGEKMSKWKDRFIQRSAKYNFPVHKPYYKLTKEEKKILWDGQGKCKGIFQFFKRLENEKYKIQNRVLIARYRGKTNCHNCDGSRLRKDALYVKINKKNIADINKMSVVEAIDFFNKLKLNPNEHKITERLLQEITSRLFFLKEVGVGYLTLDRASKTLSGGESQRINLASSIGSSLVGSMYILDEPSIGLHSKDTKKLIKILKKLRDLGNTVIVVEHDEDIMCEADQIIDIGLEAGTNGGKVIYQGYIKNIFQDKKSLTTKYLSGKLKIEVPKKRRILKDKIYLTGINKHNIKNTNLKIPIGGLTLITGVSGSGKSTLVKNVLSPAMNRYYGNYIMTEKNYESVEVSTNTLKKLEFIDQNPIGKSSRSNPSTYTKVYDDIRKLFASQKLAINRKYKAGFFSFNVEGGRCNACKGEGEITIEMQFMADVHLECEKCKGQRFKKEVLEIKFAGKNISDVLNLSIDEAISFFEYNNEFVIAKKIKYLQDVGLGYVKLGQSSNTLSGGEAQRIKLALFLSKGETKEKVLFIFDEPTTGLHFHDIKKLLNAFYALIEKGHSIICIEHNLDVIKCADWIIDIGPQAGDQGGKIIFEGTPEEIINSKKSTTGKFLKKKISN